MRFYWLCEHYYCNAYSFETKGGWIIAGPVFEDVNLPVWLMVLFASFCFTFAVLILFAVVTLIKKPSQQKQEGYHPSAFFIAFIILAVLALLAFARYYSNGGRF